jgi:two-component system sensor kinase FixL
LTNNVQKGLQLSASRPERTAGPRWLPAATAVFALGIFIADTLTSRDIAFGVLYVAVVLLAARFGKRRSILLVAAGCVLLSVISFFLTPPVRSESAGVINTLIGMAAIVLTTALVMQSESAQSRVREQASHLDQSHEAIFARSMENEISYWNRGAEELYGWDRTEAYGKVPHDLLHTSFPSSLESIMSELMAADRWEGELVQQKRDGAAVIVSSRWSLQRNERGLPAAILETNTDITHRKRTEEALQQAEGELARINRVLLLGEMTTSIAHEVNQPLTAALTNASTALRWLAMDPPDLAETREALERIVKDCKRAGDVIGRVRGLVKKVPPRKDRLDLNETIRDVVALTHREVQKQSVILRTQLSGDLPAVRGDRVQVQQVILNLVINALEAMRAVQDRPRELIIASNGNDANQVAVEVKDTGVGFEAAGPAVDPLFQSFYTTKPGGMGMGLAISRSIVEAHGGRLSAAPNKPHGAVFRFTLPVAH